MMFDDIRNDVHAPSTRFRVKGESMVPTLLSGDVVIVTPVVVDDLIPGDYVFIAAGKVSYIHRFLKRTKQGFITKGDGNKVLDPVWDAAAIRGRVNAAWRDDKCIYSRKPKKISWNRILAYRHSFTSFLWRNIHRFKAWLLAFIMLLIPIIVISAVTLVHFEVDPGEQAIFIYWETASEVGNLGFYLWRSEEQESGYYKLPISDPSLQFIPSADEGAGAYYDYVDEEVTSGILYYYKVQDVPDTGAEGEYSQVLSGGIGVVTPTPTMTPSQTPTATPTSEDMPTSTPTPEPPQPYVRFWTENEDLTAGECTTLQWQTDNVKSVFLDGEGVSGIGAKTFCPCENEVHTLAVYFQDDTRRDYTIDLTVTGDCGDPTSTPTQSVTPTWTVEPTSTDVAATSIPRPISTPAGTKQVRVTNTAVTSIEPTNTPITDESGESEENPTLPSTDRNKEILTPTRAIVVGQTPRQFVSQSTAILAVVALAGCVLFTLGVWLWRSR